MESLLKKYSWIIYLVIIALFSSILGVVANQVVAIYLAPFTVPELADLSKETKKTARKVTRAPQKQAFKQAIQKRCFFGCSDAPDPNSCPDGCLEGQVCQAGTCVSATPAVVDSELPVLSDLAVTLLGCMVARNADYSLALLTSGAGKQTFVSGVGEFLEGDAEILEIRRDRIIIRRNNRKEYIKLANSIGGTPSAKASPTKLTSLSPAAMDLKRGTQRPKPPIDAQGNITTKAPKSTSVSKVGDNEFEVDKAMLEKQLADTKRLASQARIVPNYKNGKPHGIKVNGVAPTSLYSNIGVKSGDVIVSISGSKVTSQAKAFELIQGLKGASGATIQVERNGKPTQLKYKVK